MIEFVADKSALLDMRQVERHLAESARLNRFTNGGPSVARLEDQLRALLEIPDDKAVVATCSGTAALHAVGAAIIAERGPTRFATQAFTFPCNAQQVYADAAVVDVDANGALDLELLPPDVEAILVTNCFGHVVDIDRYEAWRRTTRKILVFDDAATPATRYHGRNALTFGDAAVVSLHHTKPIGFGEGGVAIVDRRWEEAVRRSINFGSLPGVWDAILAPPYCSNFKMSDVAAAFILAFLDTFVDTRRRHEALWSTFAHMLNALGKVRLFPHYGEVPFTNCLPVLLPRPVDIAVFERAGIAARKYYRPLRPAPRAQALYEQIVCLPLHRNVRETDLERYLDILGTCTIGDP